MILNYDCTKKEALNIVDTSPRKCYYTNNSYLKTKKKEKKIVDTGFVPGIYNYCDRWCERCPLQLRCMSYLMGKKLKERTKVNLGEEMPDDDESALARLKNIFDSTFDVLRELAEERGMGIEDIYSSEKVPRGFWGEDDEDLEAEVA